MLRDNGKHLQVHQDDGFAGSSAKVERPPPSLVGVIAQEEKSENVYHPQLWLVLLPESRCLQAGQASQES